MLLVNWHYVILRALFVMTGFFLYTLGSGSTYIYGYCDANFRLGMTREECLTFVKNGRPPI